MGYHMILWDTEKIMGITVGSLSYEIFSYSFVIAVVKTIQQISRTMVKQPPIIRI